MVHLLDLMEPEETVGKAWHGYASRLDVTASFDDAAVTLPEVRGSVVLLFRALGGGAEVEVGEAPTVRSQHRLSLRRKLGTAQEVLQLPRFDGERLGLPAVIGAFPRRELNRAAYLWIAALAAQVEMPEAEADPQVQDLAQITAIAAASDHALRLCPGLRESYREMCRLIVASRRRPALTAAEAAVEDAVRDQLEGREPTALAEGAAPRGYRTFAPVPIWPLLSLASPAAGPRPEGEESNGPPPIAATTRRKVGLRRNRNEANRRDSFIIHRFEAILSWAESMNLNRMIDDDDDENAAKAADDQDDITLSRHDRRAATRLRMHLDLSPADADLERVAKGVTYPEWNHRRRAYMPDHVRVLETDAQPDPANGFTIDPNRLARVRRQFEALRPRRVHHPRQIEGAELDLDALIASRVEMRATGRASDRIYQALRQTDRDLTVAFLLDTSRSTEAAVGDTCVIDVAREGLAALAGGIDAAGDRLGIWGFSSLCRDRVFLNRVKRFDEAMSPQVTARIAGLKPGHYTRLGAAIRHVTAQLEEQRAARKLLLVLTDGKPNDLDHYEGLHGIEDSHMAVREARRLGQSVHGIIIDEDGQDWVARIFGRGGFSLLPHPERLTRALPDIYRALIKES